MATDAYITMQNDAWDAIAYRLWGEERLFMDLIRANPEHLDVVLFPAGVELRIPPKPERISKQGLPPWM
ncbi:MAG: tail protein X [Desulfobulbus sp.]|nr:tail protein X [Desulfobulbus sp.]